MFLLLKISSHGDESDESNARKTINKQIEKLFLDFWSRVVGNTTTAGPNILPASYTTSKRTIYTKIVFLRTQISNVSHLSQKRFHSLSIITAHAVISDLIFKILLILFEAVATKVYCGCT